MPAPDEPRKPVKAQPDPYLVDSHLEVDMGSAEDLAVGIRPVPRPEPKSDQPAAPSKVSRKAPKAALQDDEDRGEREPPRPTTTLKVDTGDHKTVKCASCGGLVPRTARICIHCGMDYRTGAFVSVSDDLADVSRQMSEEGIHAPELTRHFCVPGPVQAMLAGVFQAATSGALQVLWAALLAAAARLAGVMVHYTDGHIGRKWLMCSGSCVFAAFLWTGFLGGVKDRVFERVFGIERYLHHGLTHLPRLCASFALTLPLWIAGGVACDRGMAWMLGLCLGWPAKAAIGSLMLVIAVAAGLSLLLVPTVAVLEQTGPLAAVTASARFLLRQGHNVLGLAAALTVLAGLCASVLWGFYTLANMMGPSTSPHLVYDTLNVLALSAGVGGLMGAGSAALMMLYLSHQNDNERLLAIQAKIRGPHCLPWRTRAAVVLALSLPVLFGWWEETRTGRVALFRATGLYSIVNR